MHAYVHETPAEASSASRVPEILDDRRRGRHAFFGAAARGELPGRGLDAERLACAWSSGRRPKTPCSTLLA